MSAIDNNKINNLEKGGLTGAEDVELGNLVMHKNSKKPKHLIHFSDGQTMEDPDDEEDDTDDVQQINNAPPIDPKTLTWPEWVKYYSGKGGSSVLGGLESAGETLAYYLGITTPKYHQEIDEYNRMVAKKKAEEEEAKAWQSTNPSNVPIISDPVKSEDLEASKSLTINSDRI